MNEYAAELNSQNTHLGFRQVVICDFGELASYWYVCIGRLAGLFRVDLAISSQERNEPVTTLRNLWNSHGDLSFGTFSGLTYFVSDNGQTIPVRHLTTKYS